MANNKYSTFNLKYHVIAFILPIVVIVFYCCNSNYTSKKRGFYVIDFPEKKYLKFEQAGVPYSFEYPSYASIVRDSTYFDGSPDNPFWYNVDFPTFKGRIFLSYKAIGGKSLYKIKMSNGNYKDSLGTNEFDKLVQDAFKMTNKNQEISNNISNDLILTPNHISGVSFKVGGNAATSRQFFLSDTTKNFIRGALYFDVTPNADSLAPVLQFLNKDIEHLINTFKWNNNSK